MGDYSIFQLPQNLERTLIVKKNLGAAASTIGNRRKNLQEASLPRKLGILAFSVMAGRYVNILGV